ncbi:ATP-binding protein [Actinoplanes sp. LDG1-06]|uniref:ATP-binding protein n=1 Tax=Paractinoplanes ovalisporus TaxID=2810368 RepID=A0ABS2AJA6_9ACTN|nr:ATP-binding protein [Actinoplanes ovalisporus]MBM2619448.1 ATP-binding protein [Actinoplanes ovalisporus]
MKLLRTPFVNGEAAGPMRQAAGDVLRSAGDASGNVVDDALLVISELVQNVNQHTRSDGVLSIDVVGNDVLIQVTDHDPAPPRPQAPDGHRAGGRGLLLVAAVATGWGVRRTSQGKTVWARLPITLHEDLLSSA